MGREHDRRPAPALRLRILQAGILLGPILFVSTAQALAWGLVAHRMITEAATGLVPPDAAPFFQKSSARLQDLSLEPDTVLKAREPGQETKRHFINLDALEPYPFDALPRTYAEAAERYGETKVRRQGTLPWRIAGVLDDLTSAMRKKNAPEILRLAGYLSHYAADAFQPLHLTKNADGAETCNAGIHHAFEAEMIERHAARYRDALRKSRPSVAAIDHPLAELFRWMRDSYPLAARVLKADTSALKSLKSEGRDYYEEMDRLAGPIAESQMSAAAGAVASLWYTAWVDAGRPALPSP